MLQWFKEKFSSKPILSKRDLFKQLEKGDLVKVSLKSKSYFDRCYPGGTPRLDFELINEKTFIGNIVNSHWRQPEKIWVVSVAVGRKYGMREYLFLEDEIEQIKKVNKNDL